MIALVALGLLLRFKIGEPWIVAATRRGIAALALTALPPGWPGIGFRA